MFGYKTENGIVPAGDNRCAVLSDDCVRLQKQVGVTEMEVKEVKEVKGKSKRKSKKE